MVINQLNHFQYNMIVLTQQRIDDFLKINSKAVYEYFHRQNNVFFIMNFTNYYFIIYLSINIHIYIYVTNFQCWLLFFVKLCNLHLSLRLTSSLHRCRCNSMFEKLQERGNQACKQSLNFFFNLFEKRLSV